MEWKKKVTKKQESDLGEQKSKRVCRGSCTWYAVTNV